MKVQDPSGQTWRVTRRWVPWRRRLKDVDLGSGWGGPDLSGLGDDPISAVIGIALLVLALPFLLLGLLAGAEFLLLLLLLPVAVLARAVLGQKWTVEARRGFAIVWDAPAGDWQASGLRIHEVADAIRRGEIPGPSDG